MPDAPDVLLVNTCGMAAFSLSTTLSEGLGGSELEVVQIAHALAARGHRVVVANGVPEPRHEQGVSYVPVRDATHHLPRKALYVERMSRVPFDVDPACPVFVRATDVYTPSYDALRPMLESGRAALVGVSRWQVDSSGASRTGFRHARRCIVIPPMLGSSPPVEKIPGRFIYASNPMKGLAATLELWVRVKKREPVLLRDARLVICVPGYADGKTQKPPIELTEEQRALGVFYVGAPTPAEYRKQVALSEGLFFRNTFTETFCCAAAIAERERTRTHILCDAGYGGIPEAIRTHALLTDSEDDFVEQLLLAYADARSSSDDARARAQARLCETVDDRSPEALAVSWEITLGLDRRAEGRVPYEVQTTGEAAELASLLDGEPAS